MTNAADIGTTFMAGNFTYGGGANSGDGTDMIINPLSYLAGDEGQVFVGYAINAGAVDVQGAISPQGLDQSYTGYAAAYEGVLPTLDIAEQEYSALIDNEAIRPWPKDEKIYYKLVGYNTNTQTFETWIISEEIVPRTETFNPSGSFPNIEYNVYFSPPSGNPLVNIKIVGRWIQ